MLDKAMESSRFVPLSRAVKCIKKRILSSHLMWTVRFWNIVILIKLKYIHFQSALMMMMMVMMMTMMMMTMTMMMMMMMMIMMFDSNNSGRWFMRCFFSTGCVWCYTSQIVFYPILPCTIVLTFSIHVVLILSIWTQIWMVFQWYIEEFD